MSARSTPRTSAHADTRLRRIAASLLLVPMLVGGLAGCFDDTNEVLANLQQELASQPGKWEDSFATAIHDLEGSSSKVLGEVRRIYNEALGQTMATTMCGADFVGNRLSQRLQAIRHEVDSAIPEPSIKPIFCHTNPAEAVTAGTDELVTYYGYDFADFGSQARFAASLEYADGTVLRRPFGSVSKVSDYQVSVQFQGANFTDVERTRGPVLVLRWGDDTVLSEASNSALPVMIPAPPERKKSHIDIVVTGYVGSQAGTHCVPHIDYSYTVDPEYDIDSNQGDVNHPGISEIEVRGNRQANKTLRDYNYQKTSSSAIAVQGIVCAAPRWGDGAIFERVYRVYLIARQ